MALENLFGEVALDSTVAKRFGEQSTTRAIRISNSGDNVVIDPAAGKRVRLYWIGMSSPESNSAEVLAIIKFGANVLYRWNMGAPGAFSHWQTIDGEIDENLVINLSLAQNVDVNYTFEEI